MLAAVGDVRCALTPIAEVAHESILLTQGPILVAQEPSDGGRRFFSGVFVLVFGSYVLHSLFFRSVTLDHDNMALFPIQQGCQLFLDGSAEGCGHCVERTI